MKVLVINPYTDQLLYALRDAVELKLGSFMLVGDKSTIVEKCYRNNIPSKLFTIYDIVDDFDVIEFANDLLDKNECDYLVFDEFPVQYQNKILKCEDERCYGNIDIIDIPYLRHFIFVSNYSKNHNIDFEDKKQSIMQARGFMHQLGIKKTNVALITNLNNKTDILESNIINMIIKDSGINNISIYDNFNINNLFYRDSKVNIYKSNINLLIFRNYESSRIFLDTINTFTNFKIANFIIGDVYGIDAKNFKDENNLVFALIILSKIYKANIKTNLLKSEIV